MAATNIGRFITLDGYGTLTNRFEKVQVTGIEDTKYCILRGVNKLDKEESTERRFRLRDGFAVGASVETGYRIPDQHLRDLRQEAGLRPEPKEQTPVPNTPAPKKESKVTTMAKVATRPKAAVKTAPVAPVKSGVKTRATAASVKAPAKPAATAAPVTKRPVKASPPAEPATPAKRGRKPSVELPEPGKTQIRVQISQVLFQRIKDSLKRPRTEEGKALKAALADAIEYGAYGHVLLNRALATTLAEVIDGLIPQWGTEGVSGAAQRRGAVNLFRIIAERFKIKPGQNLKAAVSAADIALAAKENPAPKRPVGRPAKAQVEEDEEDEEEEEDEDEEEVEEEEEEAPPVRKKVAPKAPVTAAKNGKTSVKAPVAPVKAKAKAKAGVRR